MAKLSALFVKSASPGKYEDGHGLRLVKRVGDSGQWVFRYTIYGRRREMGLGGLYSVSLKHAREIAADYRAMVARGIDPIEERERERREVMQGRNLLRDVALDAFESRKADLKGDGKAGRWFSPLELHILPKLGGTPVTDIDQRDIRDTLEPIWHDKAATAKKAADRLNIVLHHAAALGLDVDMQAVSKAKALLGRQRHTVKSIPSMPWREVPAFYETLDEPTITQLALRLLILTGVPIAIDEVVSWHEAQPTTNEIISARFEITIENNSAKGTSGLVQDLLPDMATSRTTQFRNGRKSSSLFHPPKENYTKVLGTVREPDRPGKLLRSTGRYGVRVSFRHAVWRPVGRGEEPHKRARLKNFAGKTYVLVPMQLAGNLITGLYFE